MKNTTPTDSYVSTLEQRLAVLTAERDSFRSSAERLSSERDILQGVVKKMRDELRQLHRMLFGRKSERFIPSDPSQLKLDFEGVAELKQEREYAAVQATARVRIKNRLRVGPKLPKNVSVASFRSIWSVGTRSSNPKRYLPAANASARRLPNCWNTSPESYTFVA